MLLALIVVFGVGLVLVVPLVLIGCGQWHLHWHRHVWIRFRSVARVRWWIGIESTIVAILHEVIAHRCIQKRCHIGATRWKEKIWSRGLECSCCEWIRLIDVFSQRGWFGNEEILVVCHWEIEQWGALWSGCGVELHFLRRLHPASGWLRDC